MKPVLHSSKKTDMGTYTTKQNYKPIPLMNYYANIFKKYWQTEFNNISKSSSAMIKLVSFQGYARFSIHKSLNSILIEAKAMEFYSAIKKYEILSFAGQWMELENIILSEVSQVQKAKVPCFLSYVDYRPNINTSSTMRNKSCQEEVINGRGKVKKGS
jgi:hypothetical protein